MYSRLSSAAIPFQELNDESFMQSEYEDYTDYGDMLSEPAAVDRRRSSASPLDRSLDFEDAHIKPPVASREEGRGRHPSGCFVGVLYWNLLWLRLLCFVPHGEKRN